MEVAGPSNDAGPSSSRTEFDPSKHPSGIIPQLQNMVATVNLGCKLDLKQIALHARNSEYNPKVRSRSAKSSRSQAEPACNTTVRHRAARWSGTTEPRL